MDAVVLEALRSYRLFEFYYLVDFPCSCLMKYTLLYAILRSPIAACECQLLRMCLDEPNFTDRGPM